MTAPSPVPGANPFGLTYQAQQYDNWVGGGQAPYSASTVFDALADAPAAGLTAATSPAHVFAENTNPPVGAGDNEPGGTP
jgi:hypothetical protein